MSDLYRMYVKFNSVTGDKKIEQKFTKIVS